MYNYKKRVFADGTVESRFYSYVVYTGDKEVVNRREYVEEPFEHTLVEEVYDFEELAQREERSKAVSRNRTIQNVYSYARANVWEHFVTLTFSPKKVDRYDYKDCTAKLSKWLNNLRRTCPDAKYVFVPEHHEDGAFHFHGLMSGISGILIDSGNHDKRGRVVYNVGKYRLGWTTATKCGNLEACSKYITKYITKELCELTKGRKRYWVSRNCDKPEEEVMILDAEEKTELYTRLERDAKRVKKVDIAIGFEKESIVYIENEGIG